MPLCEISAKSSYCAGFESIGWALDPEVAVGAEGSGLFSKDATSG